MNKNDQINRRTMLMTTALGVSSVTAGILVPTKGNAETPKPASTQVPVKLRSSDYPRFRGPFPILSTPYTESGAVDFEVLARSARFVDWCESPGMIWPQSNDSIDLLTRDEKLEGMETLAKMTRGLKTTALCLGVQGKDTLKTCSFMPDMRRSWPPPLSFHDRRTPPKRRAISANTGGLLPRSSRTGL